MKAFVEIRSQHSRGSGPNQFGGPDRYVAVQIVPSGATRLSVLNDRVAVKRGIQIIHCGEGYYSRQQTERSMLRQALTKAHGIANKINKGETIDT